MIEEKLEKSHKIISLLKLEKNIFLERLGMIDKELDSSDTDEDIHNDFKWNSAKSIPKDDPNKSSPPPIQLQPPEIVVTDQQEHKKQKLDTPNQRKTPSSTAKSRQGKDLIEYDNEGNPILPIKIGVLTLHNLGVVNFTNPLYHTARHIFPIGFKTSRSFMSTVSPDKYSIYTSSIAEGEKGPIFQVVAEDKPDYIYKATSMTGVWTSVAKDALKIRKDTSQAGKRSDNFGLQNPTIKKLVLKLPNIDKCINFQPEVGSTKKTTRSVEQKSKKPKKVRK